MKYKGEKVSGRSSVIIPIPRDGGDIVFVAQAIKGWEEFERTVPEPKPPKILMAGGKTSEDKNDPVYLTEVTKYNEKRTHFMVIRSLAATPDLEWETVDLEKSETWGNYETELKDADFSIMEINRIVQGVMRANCLDEEMIDEARRAFLAGQQGSGQ